MILLVEDEPLILMDVEDALVDAGFEVTTAHDAAAALRVLAKDAGAIRAIVTDIRLGDGATGWELARSVRQTSPSMPIVYMSGDSAGSWAAYGVPNSVMLSKPFAFPQLITAVATLLNHADALP